MRRLNTVNKYPFMAYVSLAALTLLIASTGIAAPAPTSFPSGGNVVSGTASGPNIAAAAAPSGTTMTITQTTARAIIEWQSFNLAAGNTLKFQVGAGNATLNRVVGAGNFSTIAGVIQSDGAFYLVNPNGLVWKAGAAIIAQEYFLTGAAIANSSFSNNGNAPGLGDFVTRNLNPSDHLKQAVVTQVAGPLQPGQAAVYINMKLDNNNNPIVSTNNILINNVSIASVDLGGITVPARGFTATILYTTTAPGGQTPNNYTPLQLTGDNVTLNNAMVPNAGMSNLAAKENFTIQNSNFSDGRGNRVSALGGTDTGTSVSAPNITVTGSYLAGFKPQGFNGGTTNVTVTNATVTLNAVAEGSAITGTGATVNFAAGASAANPTDYKPAKLSLDSSSTVNLGANTGLTLGGDLKNYQLPTLTGGSNSAINFASSGLKYNGTAISGTDTTSMLYNVLITGAKAPSGITINVDQTTVGNLSNDFTKGATKPDSLPIAVPPSTGVASGFGVAP
ncbi:MAG: filamentous hemagglutinin N-terminal domain-containing protein [Candidatus Symbiobacter sp.]|nr:filamentous hemagglutinin N-terminal domain-containing protein [Candidatus Symbiobacter sp.]